MCGIAGIVDFSRPPAEADVREMIESLEHRGPDFLDAKEFGAAALGHARLSILDLSAAGRQPMATDDGRYVIVYNGEVYNFLELRRELERDGTVFHSRTDTEVVLQWFAHHGLRGLPKLNGIFAFAVWDVTRHRLTLVRDRFGVKPLYYARLPNGTVRFGSEIKAVLKERTLARKIDEVSLHEFLYFGTGGLGERTLFRGIKKLEAGSFLQMGREGVMLERYWRAESVTKLNETLEGATERVRTLLDAAVKRQLVSDVPVGVFLSGGIDSSAVTALASRHYPGRLQTYAVGFDFERGVNELPKAARVARHFGTDHHEVHIAGGDLPEVVTRLVQHHDEPFSDAANIPLYLLCDRLRNRVKVVLQGDGGDEFFAGYRRYNLLAMQACLQPLARLRGWSGLLPISGPQRQRLSRMLEAFAPADPGLRMALLLTMEPRRPPPTRILSPEWRKRLEGTDPFARYRLMACRFAGTDAVQQMLLTDTQIILPDVFLEKVDRATMAHGIEARVPFLDYELTEYVMGLPAHYKVRRGQKKFLLRRALRGVVPDDVLDAPKTGFSVPYAHWLRTSLAGFARETLLTTEAAAELFDSTTVGQLLQEHTRGSHDHGFLLWKALNLALWYRRYLCGGS